MQTGCSQHHRPEAGGISRRRLGAMVASLAALPVIGWTGSSRTAFALGGASAAPTRSYPMFEEAVSHVLPDAGFQSRIALNDSILRLMRYGVIDRGKLFALYGTDGGLPPELSNVLGAPSDDAILLTAESANYYVNLLWPIGLSTQMAANEESPMNGEHLYNFASTGGWTLGRAANGGEYFNRFPIVELTDEQEALVVRIAKATHRPCCNNATFFQDCNHGSALLGLLQLGASQGLDEDALYREALAFNGFWFPDHYIRTAIFFKIARLTDWPDANPRVVLGYDYSAGGPWQQNVAAPLAQIRGLFPEEAHEGAACLL